MGYHIHVFKVVAKAEIDVGPEYKSADQAQKRALVLARADELEFRKSEIEYIAIPFETGD